MGVFSVHKLLVFKQNAGFLLHLCTYRWKRVFTFPGQLLIRSPKAFQHADRHNITAELRDHQNMTGIRTAAGFRHSSHTCLLIHCTSCCRHRPLVSSFHEYSNIWNFQTRTKTSVTLFRFVSSCFILFFNHLFSLHSLHVSANIVIT